MKKFLAGILCGAVLFGSVNAYAAVLAERSTHKVTVDGRPVSVEAYVINGNNYFQLRDLAELLDVGVTWNSAERTVEISTDSGYTEEEPSQAAPKPSTGNAGDDFYDIRVEIVNMTNDLRRQNGLPALTMDDDLMAVAQVRAEEVAATLAYRHERPDGRRTKTAAKYTGDFRYGENLGAKDLGSVEKAEDVLAQRQFDGWNQSTEHRENILYDVYHSTGVGIAQDRYGMYYIVQSFAGGDYTITGVDAPVLSK